MLKAADPAMLTDLPVTFKSELLTSMNMDNINHMFRTVPEQYFNKWKIMKVMEVDGLWIISLALI